MVRRVRRRSETRLVVPATTVMPPTALAVRMKRRRSQPRGTCDGPGVLFFHHQIDHCACKPRSNDNVATVPMRPPMRGAMIATNWIVGPSAAAPAARNPATAKPAIKGVGEERLLAPNTKAMTTITMTMPICRAALLEVPKRLMAKSFSHIGARSMTELPMTRTGVVASPNEAIADATDTARPLTSKPMSDPIQRGGGGEDGLSLLGAVGSVSVITST